MMIENSNQKEVKSKIEGWFEGDMAPESARITARYQGGLFIDESTGKPVELNDGAVVRIITPSRTLVGDDKKKHSLKQKVMFLPVDSILFFKLDVPDKGQCEYQITLLDNLFVERKGHKSGKFSYCRCKVTGEGIGDNGLVAGSLNEAYTRTSVLVRPDARTHTANAFRVMYYQGQKLDEMRPF